MLAEPFCIAGDLAEIPADYPVVVYRAAELLELLSLGDALTADRLAMLHAVKRAFPEGRILEAKDVSLLPLLVA